MRGRSSRAQERCHQVQARTTRPCLAITGTARLCSCRQGGEEAPASPSLHPLSSDLSVPWKSNPQGSHPFDQNGRAGARKRPEGNNQDRLRGDPSKLSSLSSLRSFRTQQKSILQPKVNVSCSKVSGADIYSDCTGVILCNDSLSHERPNLVRLLTPPPC